VGRPAAGRFVGAQALDRVTRFAEKHGDWVIIVARPVPVLAEASVVFAGMAGMRIGRFALLTSCANLGISAAYAGVGAYAVSMKSFLLAFAGSIIVPLAAMGVARLARI
jgi:membrane protein DedA with SNARE-associated domain